MTEKSGSPKKADAAQKAARRTQRTSGDNYDLSGDFRGAVVNIKSTIVSNAEVKDLENLPPEPGEPPFQGLQYFDEKDADRFFGREALIAKIVGRLDSHSFSDCHWRFRERQIICGEGGGYPGLAAR